MAFVTTVIPVYNGARYIGATLQSVADQTRPPDKLIVQDNCSTDTTPEIVRQFQARYASLNCEYRRNERNIGATGNFNRAFDLADQTDVLHILSADDMIKPQFFERVLPLIENVKGRSLAHCLLDYVDEEGRLIPPLAPKPAPPEQLSVPEFLRRQGELRHVYCQSVLLGTARLPMPTHFRDDLVQSADVIFFAEWAAHCESIAVLREPLCVYRVHAQSLTGGNLSSLKAWVTEEWIAMQAVAELLAKNGADSWLYRQKQKSIFAARSVVKIQDTRDKNPEFAAAIERTTKETVGLLHWTLGNIAVVARDAIRGKRRQQTSDQ